MSQKSPIDQEDDATSGIAFEGDGLTPDDKGAKDDAGGGEGVQELQGLTQSGGGEEEVRTTVQDAEPELTREQAARAPIGQGQPVQWIEGRVELPEGTPMDESLEVVARGKVFEWDRKGRREHRVEVQRDGTFRVAVSVDSKAANLRLYGKYCYLREPEAWRASSDEEVVLEPRLGAAVDVFLQTPGGTGRPGGFSARIDGVRSESHQMEHAWREGGKLHLRAMPADREFSLLARGDGYGVLRHSFQNLGAGTHTEVTVAFLEEAVIEGKAIDQKGNPVTSGKIRVTHADEDGDFRTWNEAYNALFDVKNGRFEANQLSPGKVQLRFEGRGYSLNEALVFDLRAGQSLSKTLHLHSGLAITGTVHWASGEPAAGVKVQRIGGGRSFGFDNEGPPSSTLVDAQGNFEISGFEDSDEYGLIAEGIPPGVTQPEGLSKIKARRWAKKNRVLTRADGVRPGGAPVALILGLDTGTLNGRVMDDTGAPIDRFRLSAIPKLSDDAETLGAGGQRRSVKDPDGKFALEGLPAGEWIVTATAAGYKNGEPQEVKVPSNTEVRLTLPRAAMIKGKVLSPAGQSVEAHVEAIRLDAQGEETEWSDENRKGSTANKLLGFTLNGMEAGQWKVVAELDPYGRSEPFIATLAVGDVLDEVELRLPKPGRLEGTLHRGWITGDMRVVAREVIDGQTRGNSETEEVGQDGRFAFGELPAATYRVEVERKVEPEGQGYPSFLDINLAQQVVVDADRTSRVDFAGPPAGSLVLSGRLLQGGEPATDRIVYFRGTDPERDEVQSFADGKGQYRAVLGGPGQYTVRVREPESWRNWRTWSITVTGSGEVRQDLILPGGKMTLVAMLEAGGPFTGRLRSRSLFLVRTDGPGTVRAKRVTDEGVEFEGLVKGTYAVKSRSISDGDLRYTVVSPQSITFRGEEGVQVESIVLGEACSLEGSLANVEQEGHWVAAYPLESGGEVLEWARVENGVFRFDGLPEGDVWIDRRNDGEEGRVKVTLTRGSTSRVEL